MPQLQEKNRCTGCSACAAACPVQCISMHMDQEGFAYPRIDATGCIECGACQRVCPVSFTDHFEENCSLDIYGCQNKDEAARRGSTSGGMFAALAEEILRRGGLVCAAGFDAQANVRHQIISDPAELPGLQGSKYVQSDLGDCFARICSHLKTGSTPVLFVGTPCQSEALARLVKEDQRDRLYLADLFCYGVPSPGLYEKWIAYLEKRYGQKVRNIVFRDKKYGYSGVNTRIYFQNGKILEDVFDAKSYLKTMFSHIGLRPACYDCPFRGKERHTDFTLGDMWEIGQFEPAMDDDKGTTHLQLHTERARALFVCVQERLTACHVAHLEAEARIQKIKEGAFVRKIPPKREAFFRDMVSMAYPDLIAKYLPPTQKERVARWVKPVLAHIPGSRVVFRALKRQKRKRRK